MLEGGDFSNIKLVVTPEELDLYRVKPKKEKEAKSFLNYLGNKKKRVTQKSEKQKIIDKVIQTKDFTEENIRAIVKGLGYNITENERLFIQGVAKTKISTQRVNVPPELCSKPLYYYYIFKTINKVSFITNDNLIWQLNWANEYTTNFNNVKWKDILNSFTIVNEVSIVSDAIKDECTLNKGYMQDKYEDICAINFGTLNKEEMEEFGKKNTKLQGVKEGSFNLRSDTYNFRIYKENTIIYNTKTYDLGQAFDAFKKQFFISDKKSGSKVLKDVSKKDRLKYISYLNRETTSFFPSILTFGNKVINNVITFGKFELNYDAFFKYLESINVDSFTKTELPDNILFWDTIPQFFNFVLIFRLTSKLSPLLKTELVAVYDYYDGIKSILAVWKETYTLFKRIVLGFYDGITSKISLDSISRLKPIIDKFLSQFDILKRDNTQSLVVTLLNKVKNVCSMMIRFVGTDLAKEVVQVINVAVTNMLIIEEKFNRDNLIENFRVAGISCLQVLFPSGRALIPEVRSSASFLGDVTGGGDIDSNNIKEKIINLKNKYINKVKDMNEKEEDNINKAASANKLIIPIFRRTVEKYKNGKIKDLLSYNDFNLVLDKVDGLRDELLKETMYLMSDPDWTDEDADIVTYEEIPLVKSVLDALEKGREKMAKNTVSGGQPNFSGDVVQPLNDNQNIKRAAKSKKTKRINIKDARKRAKEEEEEMKE